MKYVRMPIEVESPEEQGYETIRFNLSESSVRDRALSDLNFKPDSLNMLVLAYGEHRGIYWLRDIIAKHSGAGVEKEHVLTTAGAAGALFIIATTLLEKGDHLVVVRPNYATNLETPRAIGCEITTLDLKFEEGFALDVARLEKLLRPNTKLISITTPHNPTGVALDEAKLKAILTLGEQRGVKVLVDETYRDMSFVPKPPVAAALSPNAISVSSMSKSYGIPGIRVGWIISRDEALLERFLAAKEQIGICGSIIDEAIAAAALAEAPAFLAKIDRQLREGVAIVEAWLQREGRMEWVKPQGGCVCFPRIRADAGIDVEKFYKELAARDTLVGAGHWFEQDRRFMRIGYGWPLEPELKGGLAAITASLDAAKR